METVNFVSRGTSLSVTCYITGNFEAGNSLNLAVTAVFGQNSRATFCNVACSEILGGNSFIVRCHVTSK